MVVFSLAKRPRAPRRTLPTAARLVVGLLIFIALGTVLLLLPGMATRPLTVMEALFTATSALTVTGLSTISVARDLTRLGQVTLLGLIQLGGVGFMVAVVVTLQLLGRRIIIDDRLALKDALGIAEPGAVMRLLSRMLIILFVIEGLGAFLLWFNWRFRLPPGEVVFYAIFHATSAFCNAGFDLFTGDPRFSEVPTDTTTLTILGMLILLGALGFPVIVDVVRLRRRYHRLSLHTRITTVVVAVLVVIGALGLWIVETRPAGQLAAEPLSRQVVLATFQSVSTRTAGFSAITRLEELQPASMLLLSALMFVGSGPASMGGGITTGTFAVLFLALYGYARGHGTAVIAGRQIAPLTVRRAAAVLTISITVVLTASWLILVTHPTTLDRAVFEVVSAFATCGLSLAFTDELNTFGQLVIIFVMFWGRLGALTVVLALAPRYIPRLTYPEETILIG